MDTQLRMMQKPTFTPGEIARLRQISRPSGRCMVLPYDQFIEHDARHTEAESDAANPDYLMELGIEAGYNAVALHYGLSHRYWVKTHGRIPLIVKVNGKSGIPSDSQAFSTMTSTVEDAVRLGATGVGYTLYYGSPRQDLDIQQLNNVRKECERYGMPLVIWAYPRGEAVNKKGGKECSYMVESAVRMAVEMGGTVVKANLPKDGEDGYVENKDIPSYFRKIEKELVALDATARRQERANRVVKAAQGIPLLFSGGAEINDDDLLANATACVKAGCYGFIYGRNIWKRRKDKALEISRKLAAILDG